MGDRAKWAKSLTVCAVCRVCLCVWGCPIRGLGGPVGPGVCCCAQWSGVCSRVVVLGATGPHPPDKTMCHGLLMRPFAYSVVAASAERRLCGGAWFRGACCGALLLPV